MATGILALDPGIEAGMDLPRTNPVGLPLVPSAFSQSPRWYPWPARALAGALLAVLLERDHLTMDRRRRRAGWDGRVKACLTTIAAALLCLACPGASGETEPASARRAAQACEDPRPELCAQLYEPVCADRDNGVRCVTAPCNSTERREYPNGCEACRDPRVLSYVLGPCAE
jgi:hypothetical protein